MGECFIVTNQYLGKGILLNQSSRQVLKSFISSKTTYLPLHLLPKPKAAEIKESHRCTHSCSAILEFSNHKKAIQMKTQYRQMDSM